MEQTFQLHKGLFWSVKYHTFNKQKIKEHRGRHTETISKRFFKVNIYNDFRV
jgi:hypothetical protein